MNGEVMSERRQNSRNLLGEIRNRALGWSDLEIMSAINVLEDVLAKRLKAEAGARS